MNVRLFKPFGAAAFALALAVVAGVSPHAEAFPKLLGKKDPVVPSGGSQLADQEARAMQRLTEISPVESSGRWAQAGRAYARLAQDFPFTKTAATAQFRAAQMFEKEAKIGRSFEAYQLLIEKYPQSTEYATALERQFTLANDLRANPGGFLGFGRRTTDDLIAMYEKVIANGTRSPYAPKAQLAIAELYAARNDLGDKDKSIQAFQKIVDNYQESPEAQDAAYKIGNVNFQASQKSRDSGTLTQAQESIESARTLFPESTQAPEAQQMLEQVTEDQAEKSFKTGQFYEKKGQLKAAVIYYSDVLRNPAAPQYVDARERLNSLSSQDPKLVDSLAGMNVAQVDLAIPAKSDTKGRPDYFGPPGPPERTRKPKMRVDDPLPFTPIEEPALPSKEDTVPMKEDLLLPPPPPAPPADPTAPPPIPPTPEKPPPATPEPAPPVTPGTPATPQPAGS